MAIKNLREFIKECCLCCGFQMSHGCTYLKVVWTNCKVRLNRCIHTNITDAHVRESPALFGFWTYTGIIIYFFHNDPLTINTSIV